MIGDYFRIALKNMKHRGIRSWLTLLGIFIGVMAVIALIGLGNGLKDAVGAQFGISTTEVITVQAGGLNAYGPPGSGAVTPLTMDDLRAIERVNNVKTVLRRNLPTGKLEYNDRVLFGITTNIPDGDGRDFAYETLDIEAIVGRMLKDGDTNKVVLGYNFYVDKVGLEKPITVGKDILLQDEKFEVVGIMDKKGSFIFDNIVLVNEKPLEDLMGYGDEVDIIVVRVQNPNLIDNTKEDIEKVLRRERDVKEGEENFEVSTPEATLETVNSILGGIQAFIVIIALISVIVGAIGIVNTMTTAVMERKKEIGIMKAVGATNEQVFWQFFTEAGLLGLMGGIAGATFGTIISVAGAIGIANFLGSDPIWEINYILITVVLIGSFIIGGISGIAPALNAAKQNPVEALRS